MPHYVYYSDNNENEFWIYSSVVDSYIKEKITAGQVLDHFIQKGCTTAQAVDWLNSAEPKSNRDNMVYFVITAEMIEKYAEKVNL